MIRTNTCIHSCEESDDDCTRQMRSDVSAAKQVDPSTFKPDVEIKPSEEVPVGPKILNMSDGEQAVGGSLGVRCVARSVIAAVRRNSSDKSIPSLCGVSSRL